MGALLLLLSRGEPSNRVGRLLGCGVAGNALRSRGVWSMSPPSLSAQSHSEMLIGIEEDSDILQPQSAVMQIR